MRKVILLLLFILSGCSLFDKEPPTITLIGSETITTEVGTAFTDPGVSASDNYEKGLEVTKENFINTDKLGEYEIKYSAIDASGNESSISRTVIVEDTTPPIITLKGSDYIEVASNEEFIDPGYDVMDKSNTEVTVTVEGQVDSLGLNTLTYIATDESGNTSKVERVIDVKNYETFVYKDLKTEIGTSFFINDMIANDSNMINMIVNSRVFEVDVQDVGKLDDDNVYKEKKFDLNTVPFYQHNLLFRKVYSTNDENFIYTGIIKINGEEDTTFILKSTKDGYVDWFYEIDHKGSLKYPNVIQESDGYIVYGELVDDSLSYFTYMTKIDNNGNKVWEEFYPDQKKSKDFLVKGEDSYYIIYDEEGRSNYMKISMDTRETSNTKIYDIKPWGMFSYSDGTIMVYGADSRNNGIVYTFDGENFNELYTLENNSLRGQLELKDGSMVYNGVNETVKEPVNTITIMSKDGDILNQISYKILEYENIKKVIEVEDGLISYSTAENTLRINYIHN